MSKPIAPPRLWRWGRVEFLKDDGAGGRVTCGILDEAGGVILPSVVSGSSLAGLDPGHNPSIRVRFTLERNGTSAAPSVSWFRVTYSPLAGCLALNRNAARLSSGEDVAVRFCTRKDGMVEVTVHDAAGQIVRRLFHGELKPGDVTQRSWDGTSGRGTPVSPGLYFVTVSTPAGRETARVAVSR